MTIKKNVETTRANSTSGDSVDPKNYKESETYSPDRSNEVSISSSLGLGTRYGRYKVGEILSTSSTRRQEELLHINRRLKNLGK